MEKSSKNDTKRTGFMVIVAGEPVHVKVKPGYYCTTWNSVGIIPVR